MSETTTRPAPVQAQAVSEVLERALTKGDLSALSSEQRMDYLRAVCQSLGLNPLTRPFDFLTDKKGKVTLYARREAAEQLGRIHNVTVEIVAREIVDGMAVVQARATMPAGKGKRANEDVGVVDLGKLSGEDRANALMKAITKARRRAVLGLCGLGVLDETEAETIESPRVSREDASRQEAPRVAVQPAAALPAPQAPQGGSALPAAALLDEIKRLKAEVGLTGEAWQSFLLQFGGRKPSEMSAEQCAKVAEGLRQYAAITLAADGLPLNVDRNGSHGAPPGGFR